MQTPNKTPAHIQAIIDKQNALAKQFGFTVEDVTPEGYGVDEVEPAND